MFTGTILALLVMVVLYIVLTPYWKQLIEKHRDKAIIKSYKAAGREYGEALSYCCYGAPGNLMSAKEKFELWEKAYKKRGFKALPIHAFICHGGYDEPLMGLGQRA
jgi:hypothetical protein